MTTFDIGLEDLKDLIEGGGNNREILDTIQTLIDVLCDESLPDRLYKAHRDMVYIQAAEMALDAGRDALAQIIVDTLKHS